MAATRHTLDLSGSSGDPRAARSFVQAVLVAERGPAAAELPVAGDVQLMVSELVTNAHLYAPGPINLAIELDADEVRVIVRDCSDRLPARGTLDDVRAISGRGLAIIDQLAAAWGVDLHSPGKSIWFTVRAD